ncbi:membrane-associated phospholipid phosphatase [Halalkaliarchaeum desulfuricum]|uniref:Membrane-associated phospholipid phosphatase n=1 Tax=Halalkaliarchaeum desulfuricum TaxID=2055893 RepID=A0A343THY6_9EURY|nr:phosphatase PAP2 family protein [Halalkaliarchaeum desulfuricum]AUX08708.1 membrane-associated phospholipid phosphatase [Halalkaliarchaeum desulfuricum]
MNRYGPLWDPTVNGSLREAVEPLVPVLEVLTHLGDGAFLMVLGVLLYWFGARETRQERAFVIAVGIAVFALSVGLKGIVQLPRPELAFTPAGYPGYSFPSAHAMGSAGFYGALAASMTRGRPVWRYLAAGVLVAVVAVSRVVMGVHYVGDVLVGVLLGFGIVAFGIYYRDQWTFDPGPLFVAATAIALFAGLLGSRVFLTFSLGAALGGAIGWYLVADRPTTSVGAAVLVLGAAGLVGILVLRVATVWLGITALVNTHSISALVAEVIAYAVLTVFVLVVPWLAVRIETHPVVVSLQSTLPFRGRVVDPELQADGGEPND